MSQTDAEKIDRIKACIAQIWSEMDMVGWTLHPLCENPMAEIGELLGLDTDEMPTESRRLRLSYGRPDADMEPRR